MAAAPLVRGILALARLAGHEGEPDDETIDRRARQPGWPASGPN